MKQLSILMLNQHWFAEEFRARGHTVVTAGLGAAHQQVNLSGSSASVGKLLSRLPSGFQPDRIIWHDDSGVPWLVGLEELCIPKVFFSIDSHHHLEWHRPFSKFFDLVLVAQFGHLGHFESECEKVLWFPPWATRPLVPLEERSIDVCFRGTLDPLLHPKRAEFFRLLSERVPIDAAPGDYALVYPNAKIVLNQAVRNDLNFRTFEALSSGAMLLTPRGSMGLEELFEPGIDLVTYEPDNVSDAAEKILYYLAHEDERKAIARSGFEKVSRFHTPTARVEAIHEQLLSLESRRNIIVSPELGAEAAFLYLLSYRVRESEGMDVTDGNLVRGALRAFQRNVSSSAPLVEADALVFVLRCIEHFRTPWNEESLFVLLRALADRFPGSQLTKILLVVCAETQGEPMLAQSVAATLGADAHSLVDNMPRLLEIAREELGS